MILYWPEPSVTTDRDFSISTSLAASTLTPGSTAPDVSLTTPPIALCACAAAGYSATPINAAKTDPAIRLLIPLLLRHNKRKSVEQGVTNGDERRQSITRCCRLR